MVWLLFRVVRDRPGVVRELGDALSRYGINIREVSANPHAIYVEVDGDVNPALSELRNLGDIELIGIINSYSPNIAFSRDEYIEALRRVLKNFGAEIGAFLYRLGYEFGRLIAMNYGLGIDVETALRAFLIIAMARNRLVIREVSITGSEVRVEVAEAFDEELGMPFTRGYVHGIINTITGKPHELTTQGKTIILRVLT